MMAMSDFAYELLKAVSTQAAVSKLLLTAFQHAEAAGIDAETIETLRHYEMIAQGNFEDLMLVQSKLREAGQI